MKKGIAAHGVPQRLLTDIGVALNPARRGIIGQLVASATTLEIGPITGRPYHPTTQGKNERFHQTLFRYLDKQPLADTIPQLPAGPLPPCSRQPPRGSIARRSHRAPTSAHS